MLKLLPKLDATNDTPEKKKKKKNKNDVSTEHNTRNSRRRMVDKPRNDKLPAEAMIYNANKPKRKKKKERTG